MMEIRKQDVVFVSVALPLAIAALYVWMWRMPATDEAAKLSEKSLALVQEEDFPRRMAIARRETELRQAALETEKSRPSPESLVSPANGAHLPERQRALFAIFATNSMRIISSKADAAAPGEIGNALMKASGATECVRMTITAEGTYPALRAVLDALDAAKAAAIPENVSFAASAPNRWEIVLWL